MEDSRTQAARTHFDRWAATYEQDRASRWLREINVEFVEGDVSDRLSFTDGEFTVVLCTTAFHHFPRKQDTIAEMWRVLAPGGRLVIADANRSHPAVFVLDLLLRAFQRSHVGFESPAHLGSALLAVGFADVTTSTIWAGGYVFVRAETQS